MRIVSLLASATEAVCALGLNDRLVGISHECDYPPEVLDRPRVSRPRFDPVGLSSGEVDSAVREAVLRHGSVYTLDAELLRSLDPDLILSQAVCEVCAVPTSLAREAVDVLGHRPALLSLDAHSIGEILDGIRAIGQAADVPERAEALIAAFRARLERITSRVADAPRPRVLAIEWLDPPFVPGHWAPQMIELAGGAPVVGEPRLPSRQTTWRDLSGLDPDVLLIMPCGYKLDEARTHADRHAERLTAVAARAVDAGRAYVLNGSDYFNRSGPRTVDGVEILGAVLHPELCHYDLTDKADVWTARAVSRKQ